MSEGGKKKGRKKTPQSLFLITLSIIIMKGEEEEEGDRNISVELRGSEYRYKNILFYVLVAIIVLLVIYLLLVASISMVKDFFCDNGSCSFYSNYKIGESGVASKMADDFYHRSIWPFPFIGSFIMTMMLFFLCGMTMPFVSKHPILDILSFVVVFLINFFVIYLIFWFYYINTLTPYLRTLKKIYS